MRLVIKIMIAWAMRLSFERALAWGKRLGWWIGTVVRYRRSEVLETLRGCFPEKSATECAVLADGMYENLGQTIMETLRFDALDREWMARHVELQGLAIIREALAGGKGAIILSAHLGNFQLPGMIAGFLGLPITNITKSVKPEALNEHWQRVRKRFDLKTVDRRGSFRACLTTLKSNQLLGFLLDQNMKLREGIFVEFFGRQACTTPGMALLSVMTGSPVIPVFCWRHPDGNYRIEILPAIPPPPDREPATIRRATQGYTAIVESAIRRHPDQWIWIHRRWRTRPPAEPAPDGKAVD